MSFTNLNAPQGLRSKQSDDQMDVLPAPPHAQKSRQNSLQRRREGLDKHSEGSRSTASAQRRQKIQVGLPNPSEMTQNVNEDKKDSDENADTDKQSSQSQLLDRESQKCQSEVIEADIE